MSARSAAPTDRVPSGIKNPVRLTSSRRRTTARRSEEHTSELQSQSNLVCRLLLEKKKKIYLFCSHIYHHTTDETCPSARCTVGPGSPLQRKHSTPVTPLCRQPCAPYAHVTPRTLA